MKKFGFDTTKFSGAIKKADQEATSVYHYGHSPAKPEKHEHAPDGNCNDICNLIYWAKQASNHIENMSMFITIIEKIMDEHEGYEVLAILKELINQLNISIVTIPNSFDLIHDFDSSCKCDECISGVTLKKFGIPGFTSGSPVLSLASLQTALPHSKIKLFNDLIYTKESSEAWVCKESFLLNSLKTEQFAGLIQGKALTWVEHLVPEAIDLEEISQSDTEKIESPWFKPGTPAKQQDLALAPIGARVDVISYSSATSYTKTGKDSWSADNGYKVMDLAAYTGYKNYKWYWKEPKKGSPCAEAKKAWIEATGGIVEEAEDSVNEAEDSVNSVEMINNIDKSYTKLKATMEAINNSFSKMTYT